MVEDHLDLVERIETLKSSTRILDHDSVLAFGHRPQTSSSSLFTAAQAGFFDFSQSGERPDR
jgi:hypothetical protein